MGIALSFIAAVLAILMIAVFLPEQRRPLGVTNKARPL
jgi:hypothetical protein